MIKRQSYKKTKQKILIKKYVDPKTIPGLKVVHIGEDEWRIGKIKRNKVDRSSHCVIYGPNRKEYHVRNNMTDLLIKEYDPNFSKQRRSYDDLDNNGSFINKNGNNIIESSAKIYILTHILDQYDNWEFDLSNIPEIGPLKIIYNNGTVKNIIFDGEFKCETIDKESFFKYEIFPVAYRIN